jgi:hypothetical protein
MDTRGRPRQVRNSPGIPLNGYSENRPAEQELLHCQRKRQFLSVLTSQDHVEAIFLASLEIVREAVFLWKMPFDTPS